MHFFSSGIEQRNQQLVAELMQRAFTDHLESAPPNIRVYSR